jgi:pimeloyl-ACP methyl ester carboxylesterase
MKLKATAPLIALLTCITLIHASAGQEILRAAPIKAIDKGQRVFTCGHSFHAWFIAPILQDIAESAGLKDHEIVGVSKIGGSKAIQHWDVPEAKNQAKAALRAGKVDVLTLSCMHEPYEGIDKFADLAFEHNPSVRITLQEFWIPFDTFEWPFKGDPKSVDFDAATSKGLRALHAPHFKALDERVARINGKLGKKVMYVAPAGQEVVALREKVMAGKVPGIDKQSDLFTDKLGHPKAPIEALAAYVHFAVIYRQSPVGLPLPAVLAKSKNPRWDGKLNRVLQEIAWEAVTQHPLSGVSAETAETFGGDKTSWHGFERYDFLMNEKDFSIKPHKAGPNEKNAANAVVKGYLRCVVVAPKEAAPGKPWSWQGYYFDHEPQTEVELLKRGFHIGFVYVDAGKAWDAWYAFLTEKHGLSTKPAFVGMSRGGRNAFTWATNNPDKVSCLYVDNPAISRESLMKLGELAKYDVPLLHVCGSLDPILGNHTLVAENVYQQLGGRVSVMIQEGLAHHPHSLRDPTPIADFIVASQKPVKSVPPTAVGKTFTKASFYGVENIYREFPKEKTYISLRGPWFTEAFDRYEFRLDGIKGGVTVIAPRKAAAGMPWVFRADYVGRDAVIDLALLAKGFHIVTGPMPTDTNGIMIPHWNTVYKHLTDHGFSKKPVMEGPGGAAGAAYAWAIENSDKVSCIYGENPVLRHATSKTQPLDNLAPLAKAGVPILHVCGSADPWLEGQTRVAEKRYRDMNGRITVIVQEGQGHFPLAPKDRQAAVDFIVQHSR